MRNEDTRNRAVLVLGAAPRITVAIARALSQHGIKVDVASFQAEEPSLRSRAIRKCYRLPDWRTHANGFASALFELIRNNQFDTIIPAGDPSLAALADLYHQLQPLLLVGCPPPSSVRRVLDKAVTL